MRPPPPPSPPAPRAAQPPAAPDAVGRRDAMLAAVNVGLWYCDLPFDELAWDPTVKAHFWLPPDARVTLDTFYARLHPDDRGPTRAAIERAIAERTPYDVEYRTVAPPGHPEAGAVRWVRALGHTADDADGRPARFDGVTVDVTATRRAAERLAASEQRYEYAARATSNAIWDWDLAADRVAWTPGITTVFGHPPERVGDAGPWWYAAVHPDDRARVVRGVRAVIDGAGGGHSWTDAYRFRRGDGSYARVVDRGYVARDAAGRAVRMIGAMEDVTARHEVEERFRALVEATDQYIWTNDPEGRMTRDQPGWARLTGQTPDEYAGYGWAGAVHPDDRARTVAAWERAVAARALFEVEHRVRRHDGAWRDFWVRAAPVREPGGEVREWVGIHTDVTERRALEAARDRALAEARHERARLQEVIAQAPSAIAVTEGPDHRTVVANAAYDELTGRRPVLGRPAREAFPELEGQGFFELLDRVYATGVPYAGSEVPAPVDRDGDGVPEEYVFNFTYQPLRDVDGAVRGILTHAAEVTDQVRARQEVERKAAELAALSGALARSNTELDQFAYVASHDLKAPLRGIANLAQWIEEDLGDRAAGETAEHMRLLRGRVHRMEALIDGILAYSRAGRARLAPEPVDLGALAREAAELVSPPPGARVEIAGDLPTVVAERVPLQQVLLNLVGNAVKFAGAHRPDPLVRVGWRDAGDAVELWVADDGPGIAPEYHERVWGIFQTLQARDKVEGTGIGLSVVKKIVESRGGRAWLTSAPGAGATFHVTVPKAPAAPRDGAPDAGGA